MLTADEIAQAQEDLDDKDYNEQYGGEWESASGAAFHAFDEDVHVRPVTYDPLRPIYVGSDFNVNPMAWCLAHKTADGRGLEVFDEVWLTNTNTQETLDVLFDRYGQTHRGGWYFHGDATASARRTAASSSDYAQIRDDDRFDGSRILYPPSQPDVKDRLSSCNRLLRNAAGAVNCWVDPRCQHLIADLAHRELDDHGYPKDAGKSGTMGHMSDGWGYLVHWYWPITRRESTASAKIGIFTGG